MTKKPLYILGSAVVVGILAAATYAVLALIGMVPMDWMIFFSWLFFLTALNVIFMVAFLQRQKLFGVRGNIFAVLWFGIAIWYWSVGPIFYFLSMNLDQAQLAWVAFAYFWEVPIFGGIFVLFSAALFRPIDLFLRKGIYAESPARLYRMALRFPVEVAALIFCIGTIGYAIGSLQFGAFASMPLIEQIKGILNGVAISIFLGIFYYTFLDVALGDVRYRIERAHSALDIGKRKFHHKIVGIIVLISIGGLACINLLFFQIFQTIIHERISADFKTDIGRISTALTRATTDAEREAALHFLVREGMRSASFLLPRDADLRGFDMSEETKSFVAEHAAGVMDDLQHEPKVVAFAIDPSTNKRIISVVFPADLYGQYRSLLGFMVLAELFVIMLIATISTYASEALTRAVRVFAGVLQSPKINLQAKGLHIATGDEFGELSRTFLRYIRQSEELKVSLSEKVTTLEDTKKAMLNVLEDLEAEKGRAEREEAKYGALLGSIGEGVLAEDQGGTVIMANHEARKLLGYTTYEIVGKKMHEMLPLFDERGHVVAPEARPSRTVLETGKTVSGRYLYERKNKTKIPVALTITPVVLGERTVGAVQVFRDITKEREIDRAKNEFIAIASHQLRTPLTAIQWASELFAKKEKISASGKQYIHDIQMSAQSLNKLVLLLLNVSRLEEGKLSITPVPIDAVQCVQEYCDGLAPLFAQKKVRLVFKPHPEKLPIKSDLALFRSVILESLTSNALEYTPAGGTVHISLEELEQSFVLKVSDSGIGIPESERGRIFEKMFRGSNASLMKAGGTGLGLYMVKKVVLLLGGAIRFESEENKGTTFFIELPREQRVEEGAKLVA